LLRVRGHSNGTRDPEGELVHAQRARLGPKKRKVLFCECVIADGKGPHLGEILIHVGAHIHLAVALTGQRVTQLGQRPAYGEHSATPQYEHGYQRRNRYGDARCYAD
jgi:hypothetical protein